MHITANRDQSVTIRTADLTITLEVVKEEGGGGFLTDLGAAVEEHLESKAHPWQLLGARIAIPADAEDDRLTSTLEHVYKVTRVQGAGYAVTSEFPA